MEGVTRNAAESLAQAMLSFLIDVSNAAMASGWAASNPVVPTKAPRVGRSKPGDLIRKQTISRMFAAARDKSGLAWAGDPPAFHEIRSRAARLYAKERGNDFAQALRGHKAAKCAALHRDSRGAEWIEIRM